MLISYDENLRLGRLDEVTFLGGGVYLDRQRAMRMLCAEEVVGYIGGVYGRDSSCD
jgi:hypothetical protein